MCGRPPIHQLRTGLDTRPYNAARLHRDLYEQVSRPPTHARTHTDTLAKFLR